MVGFSLIRSSGHQVDDECRDEYRFKFGTTSVATYSRLGSSIINIRDGWVVE